MTRTMIKAAAVAAAAIAVSASGAFAFPTLTGTFNYSTAVKASPSFVSPTINWASAGDDTVVLAKFGTWYKVKVAGPDGWVRTNAVSLNYYPGPSYPPYPTYPTYPSPIHACFWGPIGYVCIN